MKAECKFVVGSLTFTLAIYLVYASGIVNFINDLPHLQALIRQSGISVTASIFCYLLLPLFCCYPVVSWSLAVALFLVHYWGLCFR